MTPSGRWRFGTRQAVVIAVLCLLASPPLWALQKALKSKAHNYPKTPVELKNSQVTLVETFTSPTQIMMPDAKAKTTRVRYANRAGLSPSVFVLKGDVLCTNTSVQPVEVVSLTVVALDAFHQPVQIPGKGGAFSVQQVMEMLPRGVSKRVAWEQAVGSTDVYEVAVVVTRVRFTDGKVWIAPAEELLDIF